MTFTVNEGRADRIARAGLGFALLLAGFTGFLPAAASNAATVLGLIVLTTALTGWCPLYMLLRLDTRRR
jgi:hypothetical protein